MNFSLHSLKNWIFPAICIGATLGVFMAGAVVVGGIVMGMISTIALWMSIQRFPEWLKGLMAKNTFTILVSDLVFLKVSAAIMMLLGGGVTVFVAIITQMVLLGLLIETMKPKEETTTDITTVQYSVVS